MRVLIVEDSRDVSAAMAELLRSRDHSAEIVERVGDATMLLKDEEFDLIILDLNLPDQPGDILLSHLKSHKLDVPVFVVSARADLEDRVQLLESGADDYLVKPFDPLEFLARVSALLRRPKQRSADRCTFGGVSFDFDQRLVTLARSGQEIHLTPRERSVLGALMRKPGDVVSKDNLSNALYSLNSDVQQSAVEVYVSRIRSKLAKCDVGLEIKSLRGAGYRLSEKTSG